MTVMGVNIIMIKLTGLWLNESKDGKNKYFSGSLGQGRILIMKNSFKKEGSNEPDYTLYIEESLKKDKKEDETVATSLDDEFPF